jgi:NitT/TauT family transport system substrate-binding protein
MASIWLLVSCAQAAPPSSTGASGAPANAAAPSAVPAALKPAASPSGAPSPSASASPAAAGSPAASVPLTTNPSGPPLNPPAHINFGDNQTLGVADIYIALDRGYYQQEGLSVDLQQLGAPQVTIQALATNQIDFAIANPDPSLFNAFDRNLDMKMLAAVTRNKPGDHPASFLVRSELLDSGQYTSPKDLKGKAVGIPALQSQFYVNLVMQKDGLTAADVDIKQFQQPSDLISAFASKSVDAGWTADPTVTQIESQGLARTVYKTGDLFPGAVGAALSMSPNYATQNPEAAYRFVYATMRGHLDYYHAFIAKDVDKAPIIQILINHTPIKDPALYDTIGLASVDAVPTMDTQSWEVLQSYFVQINLETHAADLASHVDNSYIQKAAQQMGLQ